MVIIYSHVIPNQHDYLLGNSNSYIFHNYTLQSNENEWELGLLN